MVRDGNSITLWGTNNLLGEVTYSCFSVSRLVLFSLCIIWYRASSHWRGMQFETLVAFLYTQLVLLTTHHTLITPHITIHHTLVTPSTIRHTLVVPYLPFTIYSLCPNYQRYCNHSYQYELLVKPVLMIAMYTVWKVDLQLHWSY